MKKELLVSLWALANQAAAYLCMNVSADDVIGVLIWAASIFNIFAFLVYILCEVEEYW